MGRTSQKSFLPSFPHALPVVGDQLSVICMKSARAEFRLTGTAYAPANRQHSMAQLLLLDANILAGTSSHCASYLQATLFRRHDDWSFPRS